MEEKKPRNILESIFYGVGVVNDNVLTLSENLKEMQDAVASMQQRVDEVLHVFSQPAPEEPTVPGEESAVTESREQSKSVEL